MECKEIIDTLWELPPWDLVVIAANYDLVLLVRLWPLWVAIVAAPLVYGWLFAGNGE